MFRSEYCSETMIRTSSSPWVYDHEFEKIEFVEDGDRALRQSLEVCRTS